jgi:hypothetical protein
MKDQTKGAHASRLGPTRAEGSDDLQGPVKAAPLDAIPAAVTVLQRSSNATGGDEPADA